jgi:aminoglycoside phosphotransferase (APT) family kinase protein
MGDQTADTTDAGVDAPPGAARPEASRRDPDQTRGALQVWLAATLPEGSDPQVDSLVVPESNGMSSETVLFDASWVVDGEREHHELVARIAPEPSSVPVFETYDLDAQFKVMAKVRELSDVPVPEVHWLEEDEAAIGAPFFIMSRAYGVVPPDVMPYNFGDSWVYDATPEDQQRLEATTVDALVALHGIDDPEEHFAFLASSAEGDTALRRHVADLRSYYEWVASDGNRSPLIERTFAWMEENWPDEDTDVVLSWGDARIGNTMYDDFEPVAVLDWEMAALAPREVDLAWMIFLHRFFEDIASVMELPGMPEFMHRERIIELYAERSGYTPRDMDFYTVYAALRHAVVMSQVQRRAIAFGQAEMPTDIDDLIMPRQTLEEMLEGAYWERVLGSSS